MVLGRILGRFPVDVASRTCLLYTLVVHSVEVNIFSASFACSHLQLWSFVFRPFSSPCSRRKFNTVRKIPMFKYCLSILPKPASSSHPCSLSCKREILSWLPMFFSLGFFLKSPDWKLFSNLICFFPPVLLCLDGRRQVNEKSLVQRYICTHTGLFLVIDLKANKKLLKISVYIQDFNII